jgi:hypothetical protein
MPKSVPSKVSYEDVDVVVDDDDEDEDNNENEVGGLEYPFQCAHNGCNCEKTASDVPAKRRTIKLGIPNIRWSYL